MIWSLFFYDIMFNSDIGGNYMETMQTMLTRKSTREFKTKQISDEDLSKILLAGAISPVARRKYAECRLTVVQSKEVLRVLGEKTAKNPLHPGANPFYSAPTLIFVSTMDDPSNMNIASASCIIENMHLAATDLNLGSVLLYGMINDIKNKPDLLNIIEIPHGFTPICALAVGYPVVHLSLREAPVNQIVVNFVK